MDKALLRRREKPCLRSRFIQRLSSWLVLSTTLTVGLGEALAPRARANTVYWDINGASTGAAATGVATGTWDASNLFWNNAAGTGAAAAWASGDIAVFAAGNNATNPYTVTVAGTQGIGGLAFEEGVVTLSGGTLQMTVPSTFDVATGLTATVNSIVDGAFDLTKTGGGTLVLGGPNTYSGRTLINGGTLSISSDGNLGAVPGVGTPDSVTFGGSATLQITGTSNPVINSNRGITIGNTFTGTVQVVSATNTATYAGAIAGVAGTTFKKSGAGTLELQSDSSAFFAGALNVDGGTLKLSGNGALGGASSVTLGNRGTITLDNTATNLGDRISGGFTSAGGTLNFTHGGVAGTNYSESVGGLTLNAGALTINGSQAAGGQTSAVTVASITRNAGGTLFFSGAGAGADTRNQLILTSVTGLPAVGVVIPWAVVSEGTGATTGFAIHSGAGSSLSRLTTYATGAMSTWAAGVNARPVADDSTNNAVQTVNTITLDDTIDLLGTALTGDRIITMSGAGGGAFLQTGGTSTITNNGTSSYQFAFGGNEALFHVLGTLDIGTGSTADTNLTGTTGLTKSGAGTLIIRGTSTITGTYRVNEGVLEGRIAGSFGATQPMLLNGGTLRLASNTAVTFTPVITVAADSTIQVAAVSGGASVTHTVGAFSIGGGRTVSVTSNGITSGNAYGLNTGAFTVTTGGAIIDVANNGAGLGTMTIGTMSGVFPITKTGAGDLFTSSTTAGFSGPLDVQGGRVGWSPASGTVAQTQPISGSTTIIKSGAGAVNLSGASTFVGPITINAGTLAFATATDNGAPSSLGASADAITNTAAATLSFNGSTNQITNRPINSTAAALALTLAGTANATITYSGALNYAGNSLTLTGNATSAGIISGGITQTGTAVDLLVNSGNWTLGGAVSTIADDIVITGATASLTLTVTGSLNHTAGSSNGLFMRSGGTVILGANEVALAGGLDFITIGDTAGTGVLNTNGFTITAPALNLGGVTSGFIGNITGSGAVNVTTTITLAEGTVSGGLAGAGAITKTGMATVTLSGDNSGLTGATAAIITSGTLVLDYTANNATKLRAATGLDMRGGLLTLNGSASTNTTQSVGSLVLTAGGANIIDVNSAGGFSATLNLGAISRSALSSDATIRFELPVNGAITTTSVNNVATPAGILGGWATVTSGAGTFFARNDGSTNIVAANTTFQDAVGSWVNGDNVSDSAGFSGSAVNPLSINSLRFDANAASNVTIGVGNVLHLPTGGILMTTNAATGAHTISGGRLTSGINEFIFTQDSAQSLTVSSSIGGGAGITKSGNGTLVLAGNNNFTGVVELFQGTLVASGGNAIGDGVTINIADERASTLQIAGNETVGLVFGGSIAANQVFGTIDITAGSTLTVRGGSSSLSYAGVFSGSGTLIKNSTLNGSNWNLTGSTTSGFTGSVIINGGLLQLSGSTGRLNAATSFTINKGGNFLIDNNGTSPTDRLSDSAAFFLNSADGTFSGSTIVRGLAIRTTNTSTADETVGALTFASGANYFAGETTGAGGNAAIIADNFVRTNNATISARGRALGTTTDRNRLLIGTAANQTAFIGTTDNANLVGGDGAAGSKTIDIVPWAIGEATVTGTMLDTNMGNSLVTYVAGAGFRPLDLTPGTGEYNTFASKASNQDNIRESRTTDLAGIAATTLNALVLHNNNTTASTVKFTGAGGTLSITSGTMLFTLNSGAVPGANSIVLEGFGGIAMGGTGVTNEYVIFVVNPSSAAGTATLSATISAPLTSTADITKSGRGTLLLSGGNTAGGGTQKTTLNEGVLQIGSLANIGGATGGLVFAGGTLLLGAGFADDLSTRTISFLPGGGTLDTTTISPTLANNFGTGAGSLTIIGGGQVTFGGNAGYTGATNIQNGRLNLKGGGNNRLTTTSVLVLGSGASSGIVQLGDPAGGASNQTIGELSTSGTGTANAIVGGAAAVSTLTVNQSTTTTYAGALGGAGANENNVALVKSGSGTLSLDRASTFTGGLTIKGGTVIANAVDALGATTNAITIGDTSGSADATLSLPVTATYANPITVAAGSTGALTLLGGSTTFAPILSGPVTLNNNLIVAKQGTTGNFELSGGITGTGNLVLSNVGTGAGTILLSTNAINHAGSITNNGFNPVVTTISASIGSNVTDLIQRSPGGTLTLSGTSIAYTGATSVFSGTLNIAGGAAAPLSTNALTVAGGATLSLVNTAGQAVNLGSGAISLGAGAGTTILNFELGSTSAYDHFTSTSAATTSGNVQFNLTGLAGLGVGTYDLFTAASGLNGATYSINTFTGVAGGVTYSLLVDPTFVRLSVAASSGDLYWRGGVNNSWSGMSGLNSNFTTDPAGALNAHGTPGAGSTVIFSAANVAGPAISTTLDGSVSVNALKFTASPSGVTSVSIAAGTPSSSSITIAPTLATDGIDIADNAGTITISAPIVLGAAQTWTVSGTGASLATSGGVTGGAAAALTKSGNGTLLMSGTNSYSGNTTVSGGVLQAGVANAFSANSAYTIDAAGTLRLNGFSNAIGSLSGSGIVQNNHASTAATLTFGSGNFSGTFQNGNTAALAIIKNTAGTFTYSGTATHTGNTTINGGVFNLTGSITGNNTTSLLAYGGVAGNTIVNISGNLSVFSTTGGNISGAVSIYNQTAGTVTNVGSSANAQYVTRAAGSYGYFNLTGGTYKSTLRFTVNGSANLGSATNPATSSIGVIYVGGTGFLDNTNGEWFINGYSLGQITVATGGSIDHTGSSQPFAIFMDSTTAGGTHGTLNLAGGTVSTGATAVRFGNSTTNGSGNTGFINLAGGTLNTGANISSSLNASGANNIYLNFAGGTLRTTAATSAWIPVSTGAVTYTATLYGPVDNSAVMGDTSQNFTGGLTVNTNGFASTLTNVFNGATGAGVTQADLTVTGGTGYVGAPAVIFSTAGVVAGGSPAAGYAIISGGAVVGIVITSPGTYAPGTVPTITLSGGGGTGASIVASALSTLNVSGGFTKAGAGQLTLSGASTFTGPLTISAGTLSSATFNNIGANGPLGAGLATDATTNAASIVINGGILSYAGAGATTTDRLFTVGAAGGEVDSTSATAANTIAFNNVNSIAYTGAGARTLTFGGANTGTNAFLPVIGNAGADAVTVGKLGAGKWLLSGLNTYTGGTNIAAGTLAFDSGALGTAGLITFTGTSILQWNGVNTQDLSARLVLANAVTGTIDVGTNNVIFANGVGTTGGTAGVLVKAGSGSLTLNGPATHTGGVTLSAGLLNIGHAGALGTGLFTISGAGSSIDNTSGAPLVLSTNHAQAWNVDFAFAGSNDLEFGTGNITLGATRIVTVTANTLTEGGVIDDGASTFTLTKAGAGTLYLKGANTFGNNSAVTINAGTLKLDSFAALGANTNDLVFGADQTTLWVTSTTSNTTNQFISVAGTNTNNKAIIRVDSGATLTLAFGNTGSSTSGMVVNGTGTGGFIKTGAGTLALSGSNSAWDGTTAGSIGLRIDQGTVSIRAGGGSNDAQVLGDTAGQWSVGLNGGTMSMDSDTSLGVFPGVVLSASSALVSNLATPGAGITHQINKTAFVVNSGGWTLAVQGGANVTSGTAGIAFGATTLNGDVTFDISNPLAAGTNTLLTLGAVTNNGNLISLSGNGSFGQTGVFAGTGGLRLNSAYSGVATLSQVNTYSGVTTVNGGALSFAASNHLGDASTTNEIALGGGTLRYTGTGTVDLNVNRQLMLTTGTSSTIEVGAGTAVLQATGGITTAGAASLVKTGLGVLSVTGAVNLSGGNLTVNGGTLIAGLTATGANAVSISGGASLQLVDSTATVLTLGSGAGALTLNAGARLGLELAASGTNDRISVGTGGSAFTAGGTITLDFYALAGFGAGSYILLQADSGLLQGGVSYVLGTAPGGFNYVINATDTQVTLTTSVLSNRYWTGSQSTTSWSTVNAGPLSNFSTDSAGSLNAGAVPGAADTVIFSAATAVGPTIATTLDAAFTIDSLQFNNAPAGIAAVSISSGIGGLASTLTLAPVSTSNGIAVGAGAGAITIAAPVIAQNPQTWSVDPAGASSLTISGAVNFVAAVTKAGNGALTLGGSNSGAGGLTLTGGILNINNAAALGTGLLTIGAGTTIDNTTAGALTLSTNNTQLWNGSFTFTGTQGLNLGAGAVTLGNHLVVTTTNASQALTVGGAIGDGGNARSLTKAGAGTLILNGNNTYDGLTTVTAGVLALAGNNSGATGGVTISGGTLNLSAATALGPGVFTLAGGTINNTSGSAMTVSTNNLQNWNGNFAFTGTNSLDLGTGAVTLGTNPTVTVTANVLTVGGVIDGGFGFIKDGAGTLTLTAASTYLGTTTINNGTLIFTASQNLAAATNTLIFGALAASTSVGTLNLNAASATFGGALTVQTNSASVNTITIGSGQTLRINGAVTIGYNGGNSQTRLTVSGPGTFTIGAAGAPTNAGVQLGGSITTNVSNAATLDVSGIPVFYANLGTGTFRVGDLTNSGGTAAAGSTLLLAPTSTIIATTLTSDSPDSAVTQTIRLGSLTNLINANTINIGGSVSGRSNGVLDFLTGTGTLTVRDLAGTGRAAMNLVSGATGTGANFTGTANFAGHNVDLLLSTLNIAQRSAGATTGGVTATFTFDTGTLDVTTLVLSSRTGTAVTTGINNGTLNLMSTGGSGTVTIGTLNMAINSASNVATSQTAIAAVNIGGTGTVGITTVTMANNSIGGGAAQTQSPVQGTISISGSTTTIGTLNMNVNSSAVTLANNVSVAVLNVSGGTLNIGSGGINMANISNSLAIGTSTINLTGGATVLAGNLAYTAGAGVENTTLNLNGASAILDMGGFSIGSATATVGSGTGVLNLQAGTLRNVAQINNGANWSKTGAAADVLTLDTSNGFGGAVSVDGGVLRIRNGAALGGTVNGTTVSSGAALEISNNITTSAEPLTLNGFGTGTGGALRNTSGDNIYTGAITLGAAARINSDAGTLTLDVASGSAISGNFAVRFGGAGHVVVKDSIDTGANTLLKDGAGTLTLAGGNTYSGLTGVAEGKVIVSGSLAGAVDVSPGATLASGNNVTSAIAGTVSLLADGVAGGTLAPGDTGGTAGSTTIGQLHINGSLNLGGAGQPAHLVIEIGGTTGGTLYDQIQVTSSSSINLTSANLDLSLANSFNPTTLTLATYNTGTHQLDHNGSLLFIVKGSTNSIVGAFLNAGAADTNLAGFGTYNLGGQLFAISYEADAAGGSFTGGNDIALMAIPEPNSFAMLAGSVGLALGLQRFRRRK